MCLLPVKYRVQSLVSQSTSTSVYVAVLMALIRPTLWYGQEVIKDGLLGLLGGSSAPPLSKEVG